MAYSYQYRLTFKSDEIFNVNYINNICKHYPNSKILIEVQNTKGISSAMLRQLNSNILIRVAGGYDANRISRYGKDLFWASNYYYDSVIYSKNETIKIVEEMEKIESGINKNWSDIQKVLYIYESLKTKIMYDPKFKKKSSDEIMSLRGLITKQTVCAGYSMIFKEMLDRIGIDCEYVEGFTTPDKKGAHAWNIVNIDGKKYPIDLTWDNTKFRSGESRSLNWLAQDVQKFAMLHYPAHGEKTQNYQQNLSQIDSTIIREMYQKIGIERARNYASTTYYGIRNDGSKYIVAQVGDAVINNENFYRYYYLNFSKDGKKGIPLILYSETNLALLIKYKNFGKPKYDDKNETFDEYQRKVAQYNENVKRLDSLVSNVQFSNENIQDSLARKTYYIGSIRSKEKGSNRTEYITDVSKIKKDEKTSNLFTYPTMIFTRSDGSVFLAQQMYSKPQNIKGINIMRYDIFEFVNEEGKDVLKKNIVFTESNLFKDNRKGMRDIHLSRERLDRKANESGGYIGYYSANGIKICNSNLTNYFKTDKKIDINGGKDDNLIPTFDELRNLTEQYEILIDSPNKLDFDTSEIKIRNIKTKQIQTNKSLIEKAMFANLWLYAAGKTVLKTDTRPGDTYAFTTTSERLYNTMCKELTVSAINNGVIDTVGLFKNINDSNIHKFGGEIITKLFRTSYQTNLINNLFLKSQGIYNSFEEAKPLYNGSYAANIANSSKK